MCIALMLRNVNSQTNAKIDINCDIDIQNMQEHINSKEPGIFVFESDIREYPNLMHRDPLAHYEEQIMKLYDEMPTHVLAEYKARGDMTVLYDMLTS